MRLRASCRRIISASSAVTVSLGMLGIFGAMLAGMASHAVSRRLKELGIHIALGAQRKEVFQAALGDARSGCWSRAPFPVSNAQDTYLRDIIHHAT